MNVQCWILHLILVTPRLTWCGCGEVFRVLTLGLGCTVYCVTVSCVMCGAVPALITLHYTTHSYNYTLYHTHYTTRGYWATYYTILNTYCSLPNF